MTACTRSSSYTEFCEEFVTGRACKSLCRYLVKVPMA